MNSYELTKEIDSFLLNISVNKFILGIKLLSSTYEEVVTANQKVIANNSEQTSNLVNQIRIILNKAIQTERNGIDVFAFYEDGKNIFDRVSKLRKAFGKNNHKALLTIEIEIIEILEIYKQHVRRYDADTLYELCKKAHDLDTKLTVMSESYIPLKGALLGSNIEGQLVVVFGNISTSNKYASKLESLQLAYEELCLFCKIDTSEFPFEIIKLESGSPWYVKLAGHPAIIVILTSSLTLGAGYIHEKYILMNEIDKIPKVASAANKVMKLTESLKEQGFEVSEQMEELNKLSVHLAKQLNNLVGDQSKVEINGEEQSIPKMQEQKFLQETKKLEHQTKEI